MQGHALRSTLISLGLRIFFRDERVIGREALLHAHAQNPLLLVANHPNGIVDPLLIADALPRKRRLLFVDTLPSGRWSRRLFKGLGGREAGDAEDLARALSAGRVVLMFATPPTGGAAPDLEAAARVALTFAATQDASSSLTILPVGLFYSEPHIFRSGSLISLGRSVDLKAWRNAQPRRHDTPLDATVVHLLAGTLRERLSEVMLRAGDRDETEVVGWAASIMTGVERGPTDVGALTMTAEDRYRTHRLLAEHYAILRKSHPDDVGALETRVKNHHRALDALGIEAGEVHVEYRVGSNAHFALRELELVLLGSWLAAWGALNHVIPYRMIGPMAERRAASPHEIAGWKIFYAFIIFPLFYLAQTAIVALWLGGWASSLYLLTLPAFGYYAMVYIERIRSAGQRLRGFFKLSFNPALQSSLAKESQAIVEEMLRLAALVGNPPDSPKIPTAVHNPSGHPAGKDEAANLGS